MTTQPEHRGAARLVTVYSREGCHLCETLLARLDALRDELDFEVEVVDIDARAPLARRFNDKVPVVAVDGDILCCHRLDEKLLRLTLADDAPTEPYP
ncbi:MAG: glutaredoxin family protein [Ectothiorhodospiraceae bacterium]|jgi:glutaredoxin|nr:glutaredoxin family protein [Ectothiorhodospiraceae bacterium]